MLPAFPAACVVATHPQPHRSTQNMQEHHTTPPRSLSDLEAAHPLPLPGLPNGTATFTSAREQVPPPTTDQVRHRGKGRRRPSSNPGKRTEPVFFKELQRRLEDPRRSYCLFVCWGGSEEQEVMVPVLIEDPDDERSVYQDLQRMWREGHGWMGKTPFYGAVGVEEVEFRFVGLVGSEIIVVVKKLDILAIEHTLRERLEKAERHIDQITDLTSMDMDICRNNSDDGLWEHSFAKCLAATEPIECSFKIADECGRELDRLGLLTLPYLCFQNPDLAVDQRTLEGMAQSSCIYRTSEFSTQLLQHSYSKCRRISSAQDYRPRIAEQQFRGLVIRSSWKVEPIRNAASVFAILVVILWKICGGSWEASIAAGAFLVTLLTLSSRRTT